MGRRCAVLNCASDSARPEDFGVSFHKIPLQASVRENWFTLCKISEDKKESKIIYVCSRHFLRADFCDFKGRKYMLRQGVLPSVFPWDKSKLEAIKLEKDSDRKSLEKLIKQEVDTENTDSSSSNNEIQPEIKDEITVEYNDLIDVKLETETIDFSSNTPLEALDFNNQWTYATILEVDEGENEVLIHFDKYSNKYDEWISMDSARIRPLPKCNEDLEVENMKDESQVTFKPGERCMAFWDDTNKFPATVTQLLEDVNVNRAKRILNLVTSCDENLLDDSISEQKEEKLNKDSWKDSLPKKRQNIDIYQFMKFENNDLEELFCYPGIKYISDSSDNEPTEKTDLIENSPLNYHLSTEETESEEANNNLQQFKNNIDRVGAYSGNFVNATSDKIEKYTNCRPWTKKSGCPYCLQEITHFPRHLKRNHCEEVAVKELFSMPLNDPKRKQLLNEIRREGNFVSSFNSNLIRPVRRPTDVFETEENLDNLKEKYVICMDCLGYFRRNNLKRHRKRCTSRPISDFSNREQHLSNAQLFSVCSAASNDFYSTSRLKTEVFPIMRNDAISKTSMNDILVCCYADNVLRKHNYERIKNAISNKMRELGRLLLILKSMTGLQSLFEFLKPQFYDNFVAATKLISGYDPETNSFKASSLALHMGANLRQVCDMATKLIIQGSPLLSCPKREETLEEIKQLKKLIEDGWKRKMFNLQDETKTGWKREMCILQKHETKTSTRIRWTKEQKKLMKDYFKEYIKIKKVPRKHEAEEFKRRYPEIFLEKNWIKIKTFVYNCYR